MEYVISVDWKAAGSLKIVRASFIAIQSDLISKAMPLQVNAFWEGIAENFQYEKCQWIYTLCKYSAVPGLQPGTYIVGRVRLWSIYNPQHTFQSKNNASAKNPFRNP
jgi:hypothetical protein